LIALAMSIRNIHTQAAGGKPAQFRLPLVSKKRKSVTALPLVLYFSE
jgi:hypothetical protein